MMHDGLPLPEPRRETVTKSMRRLYIGAARGIRQEAAALFDLDRKPDSRAGLWLRSLLSIYDSADLARLDVPWWTFPAIDFVQRFIDDRNGRARVFEYGSGASTIWLARRCSEVLTVEHDEAFSTAMQPLFGQRANVTMELAPPEVSEPPVHAGSQRKGYENLSFAGYVSTIDRHGGLFDIIVIDGRSRVHCLAKAKDRLARGGIVVFDNSNRREYRQAIAAAGLIERKLWGLAPALPYPSQTSILSLE